jgi:hypothetical protein
MTTPEEMLQQKLDHARKILAKLDEQKKLLAHYEQHPHAGQLAREQRQSVRITMHHLEDALLAVEKFKGEMV